MPVNSKMRTVTVGEKQEKDDVLIAVPSNVLQHVFVLSSSAVLVVVVVVVGRNGLSTAICLSFCLARPSPPLLSASHTSPSASRVACRARQPHVLHVNSCLACRLVPAPALMTATMICTDIVSQFLPLHC